MKNQDHFLQSINTHEHVVLNTVTPHEKNCLIDQIFKENSFISKKIDFFSVVTKENIIQCIQQAVFDLIKKLSLRNQIVDTTQHLSELLLMLNTNAKNANRFCTLILDEFHRVATVRESHMIEAEIRHALERSQYVNYVFCSSKPHLLNKMFSNRSRPLYRACDLLTIP